MTEMAGIGYQLSAISYQLSAIGYQLNFQPAFHNVFRASLRKSVRSSGYIFADQFELDDLSRWSGVHSDP